MDEAANYTYIFAGMVATVSGIVGGIVLIPPTQLRHARMWFAVAAIAAFAIPITFGISAHNPLVGTVGAFLGGCVLSGISYAGFSHLTDRINDAESNGFSDEDSINRT